MSLTGHVDKSIKNLIYFHLRKKSAKVDFKYNYCCNAILICFHLQLTYNVYVKSNHANPANIHTEDVWSSLNN